MCLGKPGRVVNNMEGPSASEAASADLHLQLASADRIRILSEVQKEELHVSEVAKRLSMTATETLRQFQRLSEAGFLEKEPDGKYRLTNYGKLALDMSSPLDFISRHKDYFKDHDAFFLPTEFRARLGELSKCEFVPTTVETINKVTRMFSGAEKHVDTVIVGTESIIEILRPRLADGVKIRWLMHEGFKARAPAVLRAWKQLPEIRWTPSVPGHIVVTDRAALLTLRGTDGTMTYQCFYGEDASSLRWVNDLFTYEFERAKPWHP